jgi:energy-coupling factor transport system permease protein
VIAVLVALTTTRNPFYLGEILLLVGLVAWAWQPAPVEETVGQFHLSVWRFGLTVVALSALFNALMVHVGAHVIFTLPSGVPLIGGPVTLEALLFGALNGLVLAGLFAAFTVVNRVVPVRAALGLVPRAYYPVAVVLSIAVTFVPSTLHAVPQIREAQAVRGRSMRGLGSWLPLIIPLLEGSLERSMQLAEAMMARGFASAEARPNQTPQALFLIGLGGVVGGWLLRLVWQQTLAGTLLLLASFAALGLGLWLAGRQHPHTVYRPAVWRRADVLIVVGAAVTAMVYLAPLPGIDRSTLFYYPYPALSWPAWDAAIGVATLGLGVPAVVAVWP